MSTTNENTEGIEIAGRKADSPETTDTGVLPLADEHVLRFAMRYALGRMTAAPEIVVVKIEELWSRLRPHTQAQMKREITEHINLKIAGDPCDEETWRRVLRLPNATNPELNR